MTRDESVGELLAVVIARRYLDNHERYVDQYAEISRRDLPIGSGEAESGVRHLLERRMSRSRLVATSTSPSNASTPHSRSNVKVNVAPSGRNHWGRREDYNRRRSHPAQPQRAASVRPLR